MEISVSNVRDAFYIAKRPVHIDCDITYLNANLQKALRQKERLSGNEIKDIYTNLKKEWDLLVNCHTSGQVPRDKTIYKEDSNGGLTPLPIPFQHGISNYLPCVLLLDTGKKSYDNFNQPIFLRVKLKKQVQRRPNWAPLLISEISICDQSGLSVLGVLDIPFTFVNLEDLKNLQICKNESSEEFRKSIFAEWKKQGAPSRLPFDLEVELADRDGVPQRHVFSFKPFDDSQSDQCVICYQGKPLPHPVIYDFIERNALGDEVILELIEKSQADNEPWSNTKQGIKNLRQYLEITFEQLYRQEKKAGRENHPNHSICMRKSGAMMFCTGLLLKETKRQNGIEVAFIYGYCSERGNNGFKQIEWIDSMDSRSEAERFSEVCPNRNHNLPWPALWTDKPEYLVYRYSLGDPKDPKTKSSGFNFNHMFTHPERFPKEYLPISSYSDRIKLEKAISEAWKRTKKRLAINYKLAVPSFYDYDKGNVFSNDENYEPICLLVPLSLTEKSRKNNEADVALVLRQQYDEKSGESYYYAPTCLSVDMARHNARIITRIEGTWLKKE